MGLEMPVGCQNGDVHQTTDLGCMREVRARGKNFGITFLEMLFGAVAVEKFSKKNVEREMESLWRACNCPQSGGDRKHAAAEEAEKQKPE